MPASPYAPLAASTTPLARLDALAQAIAATPGAEPPRAFALAVRGLDGISAHVVLAMADRQREVLTPVEAKVLARELWSLPRGHVAAHRLAGDLQTEAVLADRRAARLHLQARGA